MPSSRPRCHGHTALLPRVQKVSTSGHQVIPPWFFGLTTLVFPSLVSFVVVHVETGPIKKTPGYNLGAATEPTINASAASPMHNGHFHIFGSCCSHLSRRLCPALRSATPRPLSGDGPFGFSGPGLPYLTRMKSGISIPLAF